MRMAQQERAENSEILQMVDSKRVTWTAPTVQFLDTAFLYLAMDSVDLFGSFVKYGLVFDVDDDGGWIKSFRGERWTRLLDSWNYGRSPKEADCQNGGGSNPKGDN